ncbi:23S rRNA pseudouridine2605 synthase/23S rRNA pseudouridine2604 synthase [Desulfosalsimonas propionicica]|uniref:Pseudouridine synthase n=1 Tax=Desulfosalsimonas propionicica TaxID=332175 RepID=A0A7W0C897_9BACT|nr:pseudouridine synthase [Desulfosalsimonas propionicica]MBA2880977.1 23S rRNA pseudouridine2605 synthase/23S rRNA pseudouridine2604 synthase [Desulfosalsimonas propionicica]
MAPKEEKKRVRLQKFMADAGICSRRRAEDYIRKGLVQVNGQTVTQMGTTVDPDTDRVEVSGKPVVPARQEVYIMLNKPAGYICSCSQPGRKIVLDLVDVDQRVFPVGRLDRDSTGLVLLTSDGRIHHRLAHPSFDHEKQYEVAVDRPVSDAKLDELRCGVKLSDGMTRPAEVLRHGEKSFDITLQEGRNRQIRRMAEAVGCKVVRLHRIRMGPVWLKDLPPGQWRHLTEAEQRKLLNSCGL